MAVFWVGIDSVELALLASVSSGASGWGATDVSFGISGLGSDGAEVSPFIGAGFEVCARFGAWRLCHFCFFVWLKSVLNGTVPLDLAA